MSVLNFVICFIIFIVILVFVVVAVSSAIVVVSGFRGFIAFFQWPRNSTGLMPL